MIQLIDVNKTFLNSPVPAVQGVSMEVNAGEICAMVGPSGCGKTTILRMINRLENPSSGTVMVGGRDIQHEDPDRLRRGIGYVIQQVGLLPHRTVGENVSLVPRLLRWSEQKIKSRVINLLEMVGLDPGQVYEKFPHQLSGGQMQRVGVARALAADPPILLMDEPFGAVDPIVRNRLQEEFLKLQQQVKKTVCFVTHDINEAIKMGDRIAVLNEGRLVQYNTPLEVLSRPASDFVINILGEDRGVKLLNLTRAEALMSEAVLLQESQMDRAVQVLQESGKIVGFIKPNGDESIRYFTLEDIKMGRPVKEILEQGTCFIDSFQPVKAALETMMKRNSDVVGVLRNNSFVGVITWQDIKKHISKIREYENEC